MKTVMFVDDHPIYREGMRQTLERRIEGASVYVAGAVGEALQLLSEVRAVDLCLADYRLPDGDGLSLLRKVRAQYPLVAVGLLCAEPGFGLAEEVRSIGGVACLAKELDTEEIVAAVESLFDGEEAFHIGATDKDGPISDRRRDILVYASKGWPDKMIGEKLGISESTVRNHWHYIFQRLDVTNRTEAVTQALRRKII